METERRHLAERTAVGHLGPLDDALKAKEVTASTHLRLVNRLGQTDHALNLLILRLNLHRFRLLQFLLPFPLPFRPGVKRIKATIIIE